MNQEQIIETARELGLHYTSDIGKPGYERKGAGKGFAYFDVDHAHIHNKDIIDRIKTLRIPPAWKDVWINPDKHGHIQATGIDDRGRKQYIYHSEWVSICQQNKFNKMTFFAEVLPEIRSKVTDDMSRRGLDSKKIIATVVWLLENTFIRVGNQEYARDNKSYGLTTLRNKHVDISGDTVTFTFVGKSGVKHQVDVEHPKVAGVIKKCIELPGYELFQYPDAEGNLHPIDSRDVNEYLKSLTGEDITAKDFRTWGGTVLSAVTLHKIGPSETKTQTQKNITQAVKRVSQHLRNTPSTCRHYYIHPTVIDTYTKNLLVPYFEHALASDVKHPYRMSNDEYIVYELLKKYPLDIDCPKP